MAKDVFYLKHDANASSDLKLKALRKQYGWQAIGWWWFLAEVLRGEENYELEYSDDTFDGLAIDMDCVTDKAKEFIDYCIAKKLLAKNSDCFYSPRMKRDMEIMDALREQRREAGRISAQKRLSQNEDRASVQQVLTKRSTIKEEKIIEDNIKENKRVVPSKKTGFPKSSNNPYIKELQAYYGFPDEIDVDPIPFPAREAKFIDAMLKRNFTWEEIFNLWKEKVSARGEFVSMRWVAEDIGKRLKKKDDLDKYKHQKYGHMVQR